MVYIALLIVLAVFTLLDALITAMGIGIGCVELNPIVTLWGVQVWMFFRILLLGCILIVFFISREFCLMHFPRGLEILEKTLIALNLYIAGVVFLGSLAICMKLL